MHNTTTNFWLSDLGLWCEHYWAGRGYLSHCLTPPVVPQEDAQPWSY